MTLTGQPAEPTPFDDGALYDLLFENLDYGIDFYREQALAAQGPVLEVACGTGRILLPLLAAGVAADGLELAPAMLERAREKAAAGGFRAELFEGDMRSFRLPRRYALIVITFNAFIHNLTQEDQIATLRTCREHLLPGGRLLFDVFFMGAEYFAEADGTPVLEHEVTDPATGHRFQLYDTRRIDRVEQIQHSENEVRELATDGSLVRTYPSRFDTRWVYKPEMELLLRLAGFSRWRITNWEGAPLSGKSEGMIVSAWQE